MGSGNVKIWVAQKTNPCVCYLFQNEDSISSTILYEQCSSGPTSENLNAAQVVRRCIISGSNPEYTGGVTTILPCSSIVSCSFDDDCGYCS